MEMTRALQVVSITSEDEQEYEQLDATGDVNAISAAEFVVDQEDQEVNAVASLRRVLSAQSPYIYTFYRHHPCKILVDTGATASMISSAFVQRTNLTVYPASQGARQLE